MYLWTHVPKSINSPRLIWHSEHFPKASGPSKTQTCARAPQRSLVVLSQGRPSHSAAGQDRPWGRLGIGFQIQHSSASGTLSRKWHFTEMWSKSKYFTGISLFQVYLHHVGCLVWITLLRERDGNAQVEKLSCQTENVSFDQIPFLWKLRVYVTSQQRENLNFSGLHGTTLRYLIKMRRKKKLEWLFSPAGDFVVVIYLLNLESDYTVGPEQQQGISCWVKWELLFFRHRFLSGQVSPMALCGRAFSSTRPYSWGLSKQTLELGMCRLRHYFDYNLKTL